MMGTIEIIAASIQGIKLLTSSIEAAQAGNEEEALAYLKQVSQRVVDAEKAWEDSKN